MPASLRLKGRLMEQIGRYKTVLLAVENRAFSVLVNHFGNVGYQPP
ncbi:hypothetical protein Z947_1419 [Sulfitobacter geojensis]|nr:hypothetical protein Z947_1419 [Sulfitobacter geojensis]NYI26498.1 hypothetical protein [Sulfitobacter geojensis]